MTNGEPVVVRAVMKPLSTLMKPLKSVNIVDKAPHQAAVERSDVTAVPAACVIAENILAFTLADAFLEKFGGDNLSDTKKAYQDYLRRIK